jgi:hypothetical protein
MANTTSPHMARVHLGRNKVGVHSRIISNTHHQREPEGLVPSVIMGFSISSLLMAVGRCCDFVFILRGHGWSITSGELSVEYTKSKANTKAKPRPPAAEEVIHRDISRALVLDLSGKHAVRETLPWRIVA